MMRDSWLKKKKNVRQIGIAISWKKNPSIRNVQLYKYTLRRVINSKDEITRGSRDYRSLIETIS